MISEVVKINGSIQDVSMAAGHLSVADGIKGSLSPISTVTGALSGASRIEADISLVGTIEGAVGVPETLNGDYYDGEYEVTPDFDGRVLETQSKTMREDIVVRPIQVSYTSDMSGGNTVYIGGFIDG